MVDNNADKQEESNTDVILAAGSIDTIEHSEPTTTSSRSTTPANMENKNESNTPTTTAAASSLLLSFTNCNNLVWGKKRRRELSIAERVKVIQEKEDNPTASQEQLGRLFDISQAQVSRILKHKDEILSSWKKITFNKENADNDQDSDDEGRSSVIDMDEQNGCDAMTIRRIDEMELLDEQLSMWFDNKLKNDENTSDVSNEEIQQKAMELTKELGIDLEVTNYWVIVWKAKTMSKLALERGGVDEHQLQKHQHKIKLMEKRTRKRQYSDTTSNGFSPKSLCRTGEIVFPGQETESDTTCEDDNNQEASSSKDILNLNAGQQRRYVKKFQLPSTIYIEQEKIIEDEVQKNMEMIKARLSKSGDEGKENNLEGKLLQINGLSDKWKQKRKISNGNIVAIGNDSSSSNNWYQNKDKSMETLIKAALDNMDVMYRDQLIQTVGTCCTRILGLCGYTAIDTFVRIKEEDFVRMEELMQNLLNDMSDQTKDWLIGDRPLLKLLILRGGPKNFKFLPADITKLRALSQIMQQKLNPTFILGLQTLSNHLVSPTPTVTAATTGITINNDNK